MPLTAGTVQDSSVDGLTKNAGASDATTLRVVQASDNIPKSLDAGPYWTVVRTYTVSADMTTAAAISTAPVTNTNKLVADDILISTDTAMSFLIQEETSATVFAKVFLAANSSQQVTLRDGLKTAVANKRFFGKASVSGNVAITFAQHEEP